MKIRDIDVGIIVAISEEWKQLLKVFNISDKNKVETIDNNFVYYQFSLCTKTRTVSVVVSCINGKAGNIESSLCTSYFFKNWNPRLMCLLGIAAGIENKVKIGDVVIPYKIHDMTIKTYTENNTFRNRPITYTRHDEVNKMIKTNVDGYNFEFSIIDGSLGSDNVLIKDESFFYKYLSYDEESKGSEMEAAGFVRACEVEGNIPWLVLRGISDYGKNKTDDSQATAAYNACITLKFFLENCLDIDKISLYKKNIANNYMEDYFEHKLNTYYSKRKWRDVCEINKTISRYLLLSGQYRLRIELGEKALKASKKDNLLEYSSQVLIDDLGWTYYLLYLQTAKNQYKNTSINNINNGIKDAETIKYYYILSKGYRHLASIYRHDNNLPLASNKLNKAKEYKKNVEDINKKNELESVLLLSESKLYFAKYKDNENNLQKGKYFKNCVELAHQAEQKYMELEDYERTVKVYKFLSEVYQNSGQDEVARSYLVKMDELMKQNGRILYWD